MIPPIPPTPPQIGAPPPLGAPLPMAPMPPSPMGKGLGSMLNTDPMARSNFSMMLSDIQNQAMIPPMPMHMNEGGLVGFIQDLIKGIGSIFRGGGGQGSSGGMSFGDAFAKARREGKKVFEYNGKMFTTELKEEQVARLAKEEAEKEAEKRLERYTGPTVPAMEDPYDEAQQSRSDTPTFGNEFDVQGANKDSEAFANRLEQIKKEIERENYRRDVSERAGPEKLLEIMAQQRQMEADQSKAPDVETIPYDEDSLLETYSKLNASANRADQNVGSISNFDKFGEGNIVDVIQDRLEKLTNVSGNEELPEIPESPNLSQIMMGNNPKYFKDDNTSLGEKFQSLLKGLQNLGLSKKLSDSISDKLKILGMGGSDTVRSLGFPDLTNPTIRALYPDREGYDLNFSQGGSVPLGMTQGGNPRVEELTGKLKAMITGSSDPQEKLQEIIDYFEQAQSGGDDVSEFLEAIDIIKQSPKFMKEATRSSLLGTMPPQPKERVSDNVMGRKFGLQKDFYDELRKLIIKNPYMDAQIKLNIKDPPEGMSPMEAAMGVTGAPRYVFTPEVKELLGLSNGGSVTDAIAKLDKGGEPEDKQFKQMLQNLIGGSIFDLEQGDKEFAASMGLTAASYPVLKSLISEKGALNKRLLNPNFTLGGKEVPDYKVDFKPITKKQMYQNALKRGLGQLLKKGLPLMSLLAPSKTADASLPESMIVNKNEGGAVPIQGFANGGESYTKPFGFSPALEKLNQIIGQVDNRGPGGTGTEADTSFKDFIGSTKFDYGAAFGGEPGNPYLIATATGTPQGFGEDRDPGPAMGTPGGAKPDIESMSEQEARDYIRTMAPTTKGYTGDYSDLDTFKTYNFGDPNFQYGDFRKAAEIAGYGKENKLASDTNIISGAAEGTYRQEGDDPPETADDPTTPADPTTPTTPTTPAPTTTTPTVDPNVSEVIRQNVVMPVPTSQLPVSQGGTAPEIGSFSPLSSADIYDPNMFTDFSFPDPTASKPQVDLDKFLGIDEDKTPTAFTPDQSLEDLLSSYTDVINLNRGGNVPNGTNLAIDKFLSSMM